MCWFLLDALLPPTSQRNEREILLGSAVAGREKGRGAETQGTVSVLCVSESLQNKVRASDGDGGQDEIREVKSLAEKRRVKVKH